MMRSTLTNHDCLWFKLEVNILLVEQVMLTDNGIVAMVRVQHKKLISAIIYNNISVILRSDSRCTLFNFYILFKHFASRKCALSSDE